MTAAEAHAELATALRADVERMADELEKADRRSAEQEAIIAALRRKLHAAQDRIADLEDELGLVGAL